LAFPLSPIVDIDKSGGGGFIRDLYSVVEQLSMDFSALGRFKFIFPQNVVSVNNTIESFPMFVFRSAIGDRLSIKEKDLSNVLFSV
jgi:hypothetical protein